MNKISAIYKIVNTVTGDFYIGSSKDVKRRWRQHKCPSQWESRPNSLLYKDMQKYGVNKFRLQILAPVEPEYLKQVEQEFIEMLNPTYNSIFAKGWDIERRKETKKEWKQSESYKDASRKYQHQLCLYNGETLTLHALSLRFSRDGIKHPTLEAKKYLIEQ